MTPRETRLLAAVRNMIEADQRNALLQLERKLKGMTTQRDNWKRQAAKYRKLILEKK